MSDGAEESPACGVMMDVGIILGWLEGWYENCEERPAETVFEALENATVRMTIEGVRGFLLECVAGAHKLRHEQAFTLPTDPAS